MIHIPLCIWKIMLFAKRYNSFLSFIKHKILVFLPGFSSISSRAVADWPGSTNTVLMIIDNSKIYVARRGRTEELLFVLKNIVFLDILL